MKIRFDYVTNSSSSSFVVTVGLRLKDGKVLKYEAFAEDDGGGVDYGEVRVDRDLFDRISSADSVDELLNLLENAVAYNYAEGGESITSDHRFDPKDFDLYADIKGKSYTKDDYMEAEMGFSETDDDLGDGRSVPYSKGIVIFDKAVRKKVKSLDDIKSVVVESVHAASGEYIEGSSFPGLDWGEPGDYAECVSSKEMDIKTKEIKEKTNSKWG